MSAAPKTRVATATWGIWLGVFSAATSSISGPLARSLSETGWSPAALSMSRTFGAGLLLLLPGLLALRGRWGDARSGAPAVVFLGVGGVAGSSICLYNSIETLPISVALLVQYTAPVLVLVYTSLRRRRVPSRTTLGGVALAMVGLLLVVGIGGDDTIAQPGLVWAMFGSVCFAIYFVASEMVGPDVPPAAAMSGALLVGGVTVAVACLVGVMDASTATQDVQLRSASLGWAWPVVILILVPTVLTYLSSLMAVSILGARIASFVLLSELAFAVLAAWVLVRETPRWMQLFGGAVLVAGIVLVRLGDAEANDEALLEADPVD